MPTIHLMVGFIGFGKTTIARELEKKFSAVRLTHDEFMVERYGRNPDDFQTKYQIVDDFIRSETAKYVAQGRDVILDYGFWTHKKRDEYYKWAKTLTDNVVFHVINCDLDEAKHRIKLRSQNDETSLVIDEKAFDKLLQQYEPWHYTDDYPVVFHLNEQSKKNAAFQEKEIKHGLIRDAKITKVHFGVYGSIIKDGKILLIKKARGPYTGLYDLPGGSQEKGESYSETLKREIKEETGLNVIKLENERFKSIIFSDFTAQSEESGTLQHDAILYDVKVNGSLLTTGDGRDSNGAVWVDMTDLTAENSTPYALIAANKPLVAVADKNDKIISTHVRGTPLKPNRFVMIAAVLLFNSRGNVILQKIAAHKRWGGLWNYSAAGHVDAGENYQIAAVRELREELGISADVKYEIADFPVIRDGKQIAFHHVFTVKSDAKIIPDKSEIDEIREISLADLSREMKQHPERFFAELPIAVESYIKKFGL